MQDWTENWVEFERRGEIISLASECLYLVIKEKKKKNPVNVYLYNIVFKSAAFGYLANLTKVLHPIPKSSLHYYMYKSLSCIIYWLS